MQLSILDIYESNLIKYKNEKYNIKFFERIPDDNLTVFATIAYNSGDINNLGINLLYDKTILLDEKYKLPSYYRSHVAFKRIMADNLNDIILIILQTIKNDIENGINKRIIGLSITLDICKLRINKRARTDESKYSDSYLNLIINTYNNIYKELEKPNYKFNLINIGKFIV
jgi:hypothetical protein